MNAEGLARALRAAHGLDRRTAVLHPTVRVNRRWLP
jgi:hypothetical protein